MSFFQQMIIDEDKNICQEISKDLSNLLKNSPNFKLKKYW